MAAMFELLINKPVNIMNSLWQPINDEIASYYMDNLNLALVMMQANVQSYLPSSNSDTSFLNLLNTSWIFFQENISIPVLEFVIADLNVKEEVFTAEEVEYYWKRSSTMRAGIRSRSLIMLDAYIYDNFRIEKTYIPLNVETRKYLNYVFTELSYFISILLVYCHVLLITISVLFALGANFESIDKFCDRTQAIGTKSIESEKEFSSLEDYLIVIGYYIVVFFWILLVVVYLNYLGLFEYPSLLAYLPILLIIVLCMPVNLVIDCGFYFVAYLRGVGSTTILLLECLYDVLATLIMFVRLLVQHIRFFLMFFAFYELMEFCYWNSLGMINYNQPLYVIFTENIFYVQFYTDLMYFFMEGIIQVIKYCYEMAHYLFILTSQFFAYFGLVFWLFSFLYTSFFDVKLEDLFRLKKKIKIKRINSGSNVIYIYLISTSTPLYLF